MSSISPQPSPPTITIASRLALGQSPLRMTNAGAATGVSPWSDAAICLLAFPFVLEVQTTFYKGFIVNGSAPGGLTEVGIWDADYNKIVTTGTFTGAGASLPSSSGFAAAATPTLAPGLYYAGIAHNATTTNRFTRFSLATYGIAIWQAAGCWREAAITLGALAATATPADMTNIAFPVFGLITRSVFDV